MGSLTPRVLLVGVVLTLLITAYSAYAGLKIGGVYWPALTATILALALIGPGRKHEVNLAQTMASAGGLVAAGIVFTVPALWLLNLPIGFVEIFLIAILGGTLGVLFASRLRDELVVKLKLPYPDGTAAAKVIEAGDEKGKKAKTVFGFFGVAGWFALDRDLLRVFPSYVNLDSLHVGASRLFSFGSSVSLIPFSGGFLIGLKFTLVWFLGAVASYLVVVPYLVAQGIFSSKAMAIAAVTKPLGIGIVIGSSLVYFVMVVLPYLGKMKFSPAALRGHLFPFIAVVILLSLLTKLNLFLTIVAVIGSFVVSYIGGRITGEMNVDPMEIFAMAILLIVLLFVKVDPVSAIILAGVLCTAAGVAGDLMLDLKAGYLLKTNPEDQVKAQLLGVAISSAAIGVILISLVQAHPLGSVEWPAPQAVALSQLLASQLSIYLVYGLFLGGLITIVANSFNLGIIGAAFGIGVYAPIELSFPLFIGGLIRHLADSRKLTEDGRLVASGLIAGEGAFGVVIALSSWLGWLG